MSLPLSSLVSVIAGQGSTRTPPFPESGSHQGPGALDVLPDLQTQLGGGVEPLLVSETSPKLHGEDLGVHVSPEVQEVGFEMERFMPEGRVRADVDRRLPPSTGDPGPPGVHAAGREQQSLRRPEVCRRKPQTLPPPGAGNHRTFDGVPPAEGPRRPVEIALRQGLPDRGGGHSTAVEREQAHPLDGKPAGRPKVGEPPEVPRRLVAEGEVRADGHAPGGHRETSSVNSRTNRVSAPSSSISSAFRRRVVRSGGTFPGDSVCSGCRSKVTATDRSPSPSAASTVRLITA